MRRFYPWLLAAAVATILFGIVGWVLRKVDASVEDFLKGDHESGEDDDDVVAEPLDRPEVPQT